MSAVLVLCALVIGAGLVLAFWLEREGRRSWARHQEMVRAARVRAALAPITKAFIEFKIQIRDAFTPALMKVAAEMNRLAKALEESQR
jgi:HAMP domain-containing protein